MEGFFWWAASVGLPAQALGLSLQRLAVFRIMGSSELKKSLQIGFFRDSVAPWGGPLRGGTQCLPRGFQGEI